MNNNGKVLYEMITEEYLKDNFITAYFIDNERKNIEIQTTTEDKKKVFTTIVKYEDGDIINGKNSKSLMSLDQLHESTYQKQQKERKLFEETVMRIAQKDGLILQTDSERIDTKFYPTLVTSLFDDTDNADHVFALKLALFEMQLYLLKILQTMTQKRVKKI